MSRLQRYLAFVVVVILSGLGGADAASAPFALRHSLFDPGTNPAAHGWFGASVKMSGDLLAVSQIWDGLPPTNSGVVRIYSASAGTLLHTITNPSPREWGLFGGNMDLSGSRLIASGAGDHTNNPPSGIIHVFDLAGPSPAVPVLTLTNPVPGPDGIFGRVVAISGSRIVAGADWSEGEAYSSGIAYVFDLNSPTPTVPSLILNNPTPEPAEYFGLTVAISGERVAVGGYNCERDFPSSGAIYVYDLAGATPGTPVTEISHRDLDLPISFGFNTKLDGHLLAVSGSALNQCQFIYDLTVHIFDLSGATPQSPVAVLKDLHPCGGYAGAHSIALGGSRVAIGIVPYNNGNIGADFVHVFDVDRGSPSASIVLTNPTPVVEGTFGAALAINGTTLIVGNLRDDTRATDSGAAYIYTVAPALRSAVAAPDAMTLSWTPTNAPGYVLQWSDDLLSTNWSNAPSGATNPVTVPTTNSARFYRLALP